MRPKSWPPTSAPHNSSHWNIVPTTLAFQKHTLAPSYTTTTIYPFNGRLQWPQRLSCQAFYHQSCIIEVSNKSQSLSTIQAFNHFPHHHDKESYTESTSPSPSEFHQLAAFCDANWGGQFGSAVEDVTPLKLFKFCSLSGFLICRSGGPITWKSIRQNQTALISCEA